MIHGPALTTAIVLLISPLITACAGEADQLEDVAVRDGGGGGGGGAASVPAATGGSGGMPIMNTGPLAYDLDGSHKMGQLAFAERKGEGAVKLAGSAGDQVVSIYLMRARPRIGAGDYGCDSTAFMTFSIRATFYTSEKGSCTVTLTEFGQVGGPVGGTFTATLLNAAGEAKTLTNGSFAGTISGD
jgi:hypothetical protein